MDKTIPSEVWFVLVVTTLRILEFAPNDGVLQPTTIHGDDTNGANWMNWPVILGGHR
jgi:hypothetical protein